MIIYVYLPNMRTLYDISMRIFYYTVDILENGPYSILTIIVFYYTDVNYNSIRMFYYTVDFLSNGRFIIRMNCLFYYTDVNLH